MERQNQTNYILLELVAVAFLATGGIFIRLCGIDPIGCGFYRLFFSLPFLYPFARKEFHLLSKKDVLILLLSGIFFATDIALAYVAFEMTSVANVNILCTLTPLTIVPVTAFLFKEKIPKFYLAGALIAIIGVILLVCGKTAPTESNYLGDVLALASSVFYAGFLLISYKLRERVSGSTILFVTGIGSSSVLFLYSSIIEGFRLPTSFRDFFLVFGLSIFMQVIGQGLLAHCQGKINVNVSSIVGLMQVGFGAIYAFLLFKESLSFMELAGILVVILGIYLVKRQYD